METISRKKMLLNSFAMLCATWFILTAWLWGYLVNVFFSFPVAIVGVILWWFGRPQQGKSTLNKVAGIMLVIGVLVAVGSLAIFSLRN